MRCSNCKKRVKSGEEYCPHCNSLIQVPGATPETAKASPVKKPAVANEATGCFLKVLWGAIRFIITIFLAAIMITMGLSPDPEEQGGSIVLVVILLFMILLWYRRKRKKERSFEIPDQFMDFCENETPENVAAMMLEMGWKEHGREMRRPASRKAFRRRLIYSAIFLVLHFVLLFFAYALLETLMVCEILFLVYWVLMVKVNPKRILLKTVKRNPDAEIDAIAEEDLYDEHRSHRYLMLFAGVILGMVVTVAGTLFVHKETKLIYEIREDGAYLTECNVGILEREILVPDTVDGKPLVGVEGGVFENCGRVSSIILPETVHSIGGETFKGCKSLKTFRVPPLVTEIRGSTFEGCSALETVILHDGIIDIHAYAFQDCSWLREIDLPPNITEIHTYTFHGCTDLKEIEIPEGVVRIAAHAFEDCDSLEKVVLPDSVLELGSSAFRECNNLEEVEIGPDTTYEERTFKDSPVTVRRRYFTNEVFQRIEEELAQKKVDTVYAVYDPALGADKIATIKGERDAVILADDLRFRSEAGDGMQLLPIPVDELDAYLQKAKEAGKTRVIYRQYTKIGSEKRGTRHFMTRETTIEEALSSNE